MYMSGLHIIKTLINNYTLYIITCLLPYLIMHYINTIVLLLQYTVESRLLHVFHVSEQSDFLLEVI